MNLQSFLKKLQNTLDQEDIVQDPEEIKAYSLDRTKDFSSGGSLLLFPRDVSQVQEIILYANEDKIPLVPSGGRTGYSGGAVASNHEVIVSLKKMNQIVEFDSTLPAITAEAGVITKTLQKEVETRGYYFPIDFASSGSSMIGGNIATNAGGIRVIRYGPIRNWILGLEVVTGKGEILKFISHLFKNNTGYDLKHCFIGSEGTLGIITQATLLVTKKPKDSIVYLFAFSDLKSVLISLEISKKVLEGILCFEFFDSSCLRLVCNRHSLSYPFEELKNKECWYVLLEIEKSEYIHDDLFENFLNEIYNTNLLNATYSDIESKKKELFRYREDISEAVAMSGKFHKNDISLPIKCIDDFVNELKEIVIQNFSDFKLFLFGHLGDGNIHINLLADSLYDENLFKEKISVFDEILYKKIFEYKGSISAEHGIGLLKKKFLPYSKTKEEINYMKEIKKLFDPNCILNPGKIFDL